MLSTKVEQLIVGTYLELCMEYFHIGYTVIESLASVVNLLIDAIGSNY